MASSDNPLNIVVVEDHDFLREITLDALRSKGYFVHGVDCAEALDDLPCRPDLLVVDLNLPGEDGISLARRLRQAQPGIGIIMLTARDSLADRVTGYDSGADIYLIKPCALEELVAAVHSLGRRLQPAAAVATPWQLDAHALQLAGPGGEVALSAGECVILSGLARARGRQLESWQLIELLGKNPDEYSKANLEVQLVRLRKKLSQAGCEGPSVKAVRGQGYQLCVELSIA